MTPRKRSRKNTWMYVIDSVMRFLKENKLLWYAPICALLYGTVFRETLPGNTSVIFLWIVLYAGIPTDQSWDKVATLIRGFLEALLKTLSK